MVDSPKKNIAHLAAFAVAFILTPSPALAERTLLDVMMERKHSCLPTAHYVLKPGVNTSELLPSNANPYCMTDVKCSPLQQGEADFNTAIECEAPNAVCPELFKCAQQSVDRKKSGSDPWKVYNISPTAKTSTNKFNDYCWTTGTLKGKMAVFQFLDNGSAKDGFCIGMYSCNKNPQRKMVACRPAAGGLCPQLNDCINTEVYLPKGYTAKQLADLAPHERERFRREVQDAN